MVKQAIQIFARIKPTEHNVAVYSVDSDELTNASLKFEVSRNMAEGFVNNKRKFFKFSFRKVFDQAVKQEEIFENIAKPVAESVLAGYNGTIFAYGQTGSGKTFTITGGAERYHDRGLIPRTLSYLYERFTQDSATKFTIHISYMEIYNEIGYDLLDSRHEVSRLEDLPRVMIMEDQDQNIHLKNLSMQHSANEEEALNLLFLGDTNRIIAETPMNQASTRSHCIFTVHLCRHEMGSTTLLCSKLHLVDLAGSDRISKTRLDGRLLNEAKYINLSLHYLEQVIKALSERNRSHIPYRNSMLTSILRDSLGGNCMTTMIATMTLDMGNLGESISTCRFAQRVALINNEAVLNEELDPSLQIAKMKQEIQSLKEELVMLTGKLRDDRLTQDEIQKILDLVKTFLDDHSPNATLSVGPDMRKIQYCFYLLKMMVRDKQVGEKTDLEGQVATETVMGGREIQGCHCASEVNKLKEMLRQRDNEIRILVKILEKRKKRTEDASTQLPNITSGQNPAAKTSHFLSSMPLLYEESMEQISSGNEGQAMKYIRKGLLLSMEKQEAFETFIRDNEEQPAIDENKSLLKLRSAEARKLGVQLHEMRNKINHLKEQLEMCQRQRASHGGRLDHTEGESDFDPVEKNLRKNIEQEKKIYKSTVSHLKALRTEIEHLQLLLEKAKFKLQKDFLKHWNQSTSQKQDFESDGIQSTSTSIQPSSSENSLFKYSSVLTQCLKEITSL